MKKPRTKKTIFEIKGEIPEWLMDGLKDKYGNNVQLLDDEDDDQYVDLVGSDWYKEINSRMTPGDTLKIYREKLGLTQEELGRKLGNFSRQNVSAMENDRRGISKSVTKRLSEIFNVSPERFI